MIPEYVAYIAARHRSEWNALSARAVAPVQPEDRGRRPAALLVPLRSWLSTDLRRLADRLDPAVARRYATPAIHRR
jgi:hypothetical protein